MKRVEESTLKKMEILFNTAYHIAKNEMPFTKFAGLCALQKKNGVDVGETYMNDKALSVFIQYIDNVMTSDLKKGLDQSYFFCVLSDTSTDHSTDEEEIVYVRYMSAGLPVMSFLVDYSTVNMKSFAM